MEKIKKIYQEVRHNDYELESNVVFLGLQILNKYAKDYVIINPEHDEIWAGLTLEEYEDMSEKDIREMFSLNWRWQDELFVIFT